MSTKRTKTVKRYKRTGTPAQLIAKIRKLKTQYIATAKTYQDGKNVSAKKKCDKIANDLRKTALTLRTTVVSQINDKINAIKTAVAKQWGVKVTSSKVTKTQAIKRLQAKLKDITTCNRVTPLIKHCSVKLTTFKVPTISKSKTSRTTSKKRSSIKRGTKATTKKVPYNKHHHHKLKREIHHLKRRNSFMRKLLNQFRKKVATLKRSYKAASAKPRWKVLKGGKGSSNVVHLRSSTRTSVRRAG